MAWITIFSPPGVPSFHIYTRAHIYFHRYTPPLALVQPALPGRRLSIITASTLLSHRYRSAESRPSAVSLHPSVARECACISSLCLIVSVKCVAKHARDGWACR